MDRRTFLKSLAIGVSIPLIGKIGILESVAQLSDAKIVLEKTFDPRSANLHIRAWERDCSALVTVGAVISIMDYYIYVNETIWGRPPPNYRQFYSGLLSKKANILLAGIFPNVYISPNKILEALNGPLYRS